MPIFRYNEQPGNYYAYLIEGHGDDANDGLTPQTAVATMNRLVEVLDGYTGANRRYAVIWKDLIYNEAITHARNSGRPITFHFLKRTVIDGSGGNKIQFYVVSDRCIGGYFRDYVSSIFTITNCYFEKCVISNSLGSAISGYAGTGNIYYLNSILLNSRFGSAVGSSAYIRANFEKCVVIGSNIGSANREVVAKNTIFNNNTITVTSAHLTIDFCDVYNSTIASLDQEGLIAAGKNLNGISANPQFTDITNGQYTVNQSSPCLYRGEGGEHIGIGEGFYLQANILYFQQSVINNFQLTTGRLGFIDPLDNAFIETNPIDIGQIITLESAELAAILPVVAGEFTAGPVSYSHWYPAYSAASTYHKGAGITDSAILYRSLIDDNMNNTPASSATEWERLTWESGVSYSAGKIVQYTDDKWYKANTATSTSWVAGEWDEVVMIREWNLQVKTGRTYDEAAAADWATIPYNTTPYLDTAGLGNSDDAYNPATAAVMVFRFIAVRIDAKTIV